jgi:hypothetical protein
MTASGIRKDSHKEAQKTQKGESDAVFPLLCLLCFFVALILTNNSANSHWSVNRREV